MAERAIHPIMVGTAGHIDHGKSSLVRALTGVDPDRLKEEKERGLTIDLGFAPLRLADGRTMGMVDVPGHERLVRNMVAGSTALDLAILVVAADDGVMPQTVEHLDILDLLGVRAGLVALTKVDLVEPDLVDLAESEVVELIEKSPLAGARVVRVSSTTGAGLDVLRQALEDLAGGLAPRPHHGPFRMPVQRVFQLKGIGTVVTGIPVSGSIETGETVEFLPGGHRSKVRALQAFGGTVSRAVAGHSTALSVPDARAAGLRRGVVAALPGVFRTGDAIDVELRLTGRARPVGHRRAVRFHCGTAEVQGVLLLLDVERMEPGDTRVARLHLEEEICVAPGDPFLLRLQNPILTIGGGTVLRVAAAPRRYRRRDVGSELERLRLAGESLDDRVHEEVTLAGASGITVDQLAAALAVTAEVVEDVLAGQSGIHRHERGGGRVFPGEELDRGIAEVLSSVERMLRARPLAASVIRSSLRTSRQLPVELLDAVLDELQARGRARPGTQGRVLFLDRLRPLSEEDQRGLDTLVAHCERRGFRPATIAELVAELGQPQARVVELVARALDEGRVEQAGEHVYAASIMRTALQAIRRNCLAHDEILDIPSLRDELGTSRKYLIPLLEHVDGLGLTRLRGGVRCLLPSSAVCRELGAMDATADGVD